MQNNYPLLVSTKPLTGDFERLQEIPISSENFTLGRALACAAVIPYLPISRKHCVFNKNRNNEWVLEDHSALGIEVNGEKIGKGKSKILSANDLIKLEFSDTFVYQFLNEHNDDEVPRKRIKLEMDGVDSEDEFITIVKIKFEESQQNELKHIEEKLQSTKHLQTSSAILKQQLQLDMNRKIENLKGECATQIENLKGEKNEVEKRKALLLLERDSQLATLKEEMEGKILRLMDEIKKQNIAESELIQENNQLKQRLDKKREEFLVELNRESSSKQDMLEKLEARIKEQEEVRLKEKKELEERLQKETEQLMLAKEKELKELEEQKLLREKELVAELDCIKKSLTEQVEETQQQRLKVVQQLNEQMEQMKKLSNEDKAKMDKLQREREEIQKKLNEAQSNAEKSLDELQKRVAERETELATLAADRIQQQAEQSTEVITSLQQQLEKVKNQLQSVESEKNILLENLIDPAEQSTSKQSTLAQVGDLMESELQCSICAEMFVEAISLSCSHTFCKYCISMWKKKKKDCPICRAPITSECRCLILDSYIEKMVQNLTEELKTKRQEMLKSREDEVAASTRVATTSRISRGTRTSRGRRRRNTTTTTMHGYTTAAGGILIPTPMTTTSPRSTTSLTSRPLPTPQGQSTPMLHLQQLQATMVEGAGGSRVSQVLTTVATGAASFAEPAATGLPAAPLGNDHAYAISNTVAANASNAITCSARSTMNTSNTNVTYASPNYVTAETARNPPYITATVNSNNVIPVYTITMDNTLVHTENIQIVPDGGNIIELLDVSANRMAQDIPERPVTSNDDVIEIVDTTIVDDNIALN